MNRKEYLRNLVYGYCAGRMDAGSITIGREVNNNLKMITAAATTGTKTHLQRERETDNNEITEA